MTNNAGLGEALDNSLPVALSEFKNVREDLGVLRSSATFREMKPHTGKDYNVLNYGKLTAYNAPRGVPTAVSQALQDTLTPMTPSDVSIKVNVPGVTLRQVADADLSGQVGRMMGIAFDRKEEQDGCAQLPAFVIAIGAAGTACSPGHLNAMDSRLGYGGNRAAPEAPPAPWYYIQHPIHKSIVTGRLAPFSDVPVGTNAYTGASSTGVTVGPGRTAFGDELIQRGTGALGMFAGHMFKTCPYISVDANDDSSGALFSQDGLYYVNEVPYQMTIKPTERDGKEYLGWGAYTFALYRSGSYGVEGLYDTTELTS